MADGPAELLILGRGRSGSNLLCALLRGLEGHASFFELFDPNACRSITNVQEVHTLMQARLGFAFASLGDPALLRHVASDPMGFWATLTNVASDLGYLSLSCKIFHWHLDDATLDQFLNRPNLRLFFLNRRRIDPYISDLKAQITDAYISHDTTDLLVDANLKDFLNKSFAHDHFMERAYNRAQQLGVPSAVISYETYLDVEPSLRLQRIEGALRFVGFESPEIKTTKLDWLRKQDGSATWQAKLSNSLQFGAALAGLGLTDYAETGPLGDFVQPNELDPVKTRVELLDRDDSLQQKYTNFHVYWGDPVVTFSTLQDDHSTLAKWMAGGCPALRAKRGLHFLRPSWSMDHVNLKPLALEIQRAELDNPGHLFVTLNASSREADNYRSVGIQTIYCNGNVFEDQNRWSVPRAPHPGLPDSDSLYLARLEPWKNHHLAVMLKAPLFVYGSNVATPIDALMAEYQAKYPNAIFVNHRIENGKYKYLETEDLNATMSRARTALALSNVEGCMRASMQCLMAGLPIISVPSRGGRDAFFCDDNSLVVEPDPIAIASGVEQLIERRVSREEVRRATMSLVRAARVEFETLANRIATEHLGLDAPVIRVENMLGWTIVYRPLSHLIGALHDPV